MTILFDQRVTSIKNQIKEERDALECLKDKEKKKKKKRRKLSKVENKNNFEIKLTDAIKNKKLKQ